MTLEPSPAQGDGAQGEVGDQEKNTEMNTTRDIMEAKGLLGTEGSPPPQDREIVDYAKN